MNVLRDTLQALSDYPWTSGAGALFILAVMIIRAVLPREYHVFKWDEANNRWEEIGGSNTRHGAWSICTQDGGKVEDYWVQRRPWAAR